MKPVYLLDTNVISEFTKSVPNPAIIKKAMENDGLCAICSTEIRARCKAAGTPVTFYDSQIAATAIANNMILITHNTEDYAALAKNSMLQIEDWWE